MTTTYVRIRTYVYIRTPTRLHYPARLRARVKIHLKYMEKIEDVGLNEDLKSMETSNGHKIFMKIKQSKSYILLLFYSELSVSSWSVSAIKKIELSEY